MIQDINLINQLGCKFKFIEKMNVFILKKSFLTKVKNIIIKYHF